MNAGPGSDIPGDPFDIPTGDDDLPTVMVPPRRPGVFAVIRIDSGGAALRVSRLSPYGGFQQLRQERDTFPLASPSQPGDLRPLAIKLADVLMRYQRIAELHGAVVRAVVLPTFRTIPKHTHLLQRLSRATRVALGLISERDAARYTCLGALADRPADHQALVVEVSDEVTSVTLAKGQEPLALWRLGVGTKQLLEATLMGPLDQPDGMRMRIWRRHIQHVLSQGHLDAIRGIAAEVVLVRTPDSAPAATTHLSSVTTLNEIASHMGIRSVQSTERGLAEGVLIELSRTPAVQVDEANAAATTSTRPARET
jgi:exopolyphosphatase/pppGpp-phosphohydrolase